MLDVKRLRVLREVARRGTFSGAGEALGYTQSAISQQIATLERETGTTLVERSARGIRLTDAGEVLVRHADAILARLSDAQAELEGLAGLRGGRVRVTSFPTAQATVVPPVIARFRAHHPAVELTLLPREPHEGLQTLLDRDCDIALGIDVPGAPAVDDAVDRLHLLDDPMYVVLPDGHPLADAAELHLSDLAAEPWICGAFATCPDCQVLFRACAAAGFDPHIAFHTDDYLAMQGFVASGMGVALMPDLALVTVRDDVVVRALTGAAPVRRVHAATLRDGYRSPAAAAMLGLLAKVCGEYIEGRRSLAVAA